MATSRPLAQHPITELEQMFATSKGDSRILNPLAVELEHRTTTRAKNLLAKVVSAKTHASSTSTAAARVTAPLQTHPANQKPLWNEPEKPLATQQPLEAGGIPGTRTPDGIPNTPLTANEPAATKDWTTQATQPRPHLTLAESYKELNVTPATHWGAIEIARRKIVQSSHPDALSELDAKGQVEAVTEAIRANVACDVLFAALLKAPSLFTDMPSVRLDD